MKVTDVKFSHDFPMETRGTDIVVLPGETDMFVAIANSEGNVMAVKCMCRHELMDFIYLLMDGLEEIEKKSVLQDFVPEGKPN